MWTSVIAVLIGAAQFGQSSTGELRVSVRDSTGLPVQCRVSLVSEANDLSQQLETAADGLSVAKRLPFGRYRIAVHEPGFASYEALVEIDSALPREYRVTLTPAPVQAQVTVRAEDTLLDTHQASAVNRVGAETLQQRITTLPGRSLADVVNTEPGWLLEANGILHPRGSEYQVQYVVDGLPITDNRSPSFSPELDADGVHSMSILTGGYPAEYGRKLGGVIEVVTTANPRQGLHGSAVASAGSFATASGGATAQYGWSHTLVGVSGSAAHTDRYLDPPVEENFTNSGTGSSAAIQFEREFSDSDRLGVLIRHGQSRAITIPRAKRARPGRGGSAARAEQSRHHGTVLVSTCSFICRRRGSSRDGPVGWRRPFVERVINADRRISGSRFSRNVREGHRRRPRWAARVESRSGCGLRLCAGSALLHDLRPEGLRSERPALVFVRGSSE